MAEEAKPATEVSAEQRRALLRQILEKKAREPRVFPLSLGQDALWFLDRLDPGRPTYGFYPAVRARGELDMAALRRAFAEAMRRHDVFRTTFPEVDGAPVQRVVPASEYELPIVDLRDMDQAQRDLECRRLAEDRPPIDLQNGPVIRAQLIRIADDEHVLTLHIHHIVFDGWSLGVLVRELVALYSAFKAGQPSPLKPLTVQFADFAAWQRKHLQGEVLSQLQNHWRKRLAGLPPLELFTDHPRPVVRSSRGSTLPFKLSSELTRSVVEFSRREHFTPFMTLLAGFQELMRRYSGQEDFAIGTPTANRRQKSFEPLVGYFINVLVLRADLSNDPTFRQLVQRVRDTALEAFQNQELTLDKIVEAVQLPRDLSRHPLFQVMFVVQNNPPPSIALPGVTLAPLGEMQPARTAKFELTVPLKMTPRGFEGKINFNTDLFTADTIARMADHYQMVLADSLENPDLPLSKLKLLREHEYQRIVVDWNSRRLPVAPPRLVPDRFARQAQRAAEAIAVVDPNRSWTYGDIDEASNRLARCLQQRGVGPERTVGVCLDRSGELMIVLLAILKAGGAYVPLDPGHAGAADGRFRFFLDDAQMTLVVSDEAHFALLPSDDPRLFVLERERVTVAAISSEEVPHGATLETLAYIIYTSGSTGRPNGVMVTHGNLENAYLGWEHEYRLGTDVTSHLQMASFGFDVFTGDFVRALCSGGKLVFCSKETMLEPVALLDVLRRERIDAAEFVPVVLRNLVQHLAATGEKLDFMRMVAVGSDAWYVEDHQRALEVVGPGTRLVNSYGLTETTIDSTFFEGDVQSLPTTGIVPIGRSFPNVQLYVLDRWMRPTPIGIAGELFVGGAGVARGYWNRPALDAERFVADPFATTLGARLCRTGDRVRWRGDGQLEFLGRADDQVKIRGFRIEPGEVEEVLREHPALAEAAVLARERHPGDLRLVAYIAPRHGEQPSIPELRRFLGERLPEYMIPTAFVSLEFMPTTPNGKVDRRSLPEPQWEQASGAGKYVAPRTLLEQQLAAMWTQILGVPKVSVHDSFFELGGNSLMAVRLTARIRKEFQIELPLVALFTAPTLGSLGERVGDLVAHGARSAGAPILFEAVLDDPNQPISQLSSLSADERRPVASLDALVSTQSVAPASPPALPVVVSVDPTTQVSSTASEIHAVPRSPAAVHRRWLAPLRAKGDKLPLYCIHGLGGHIAGFLPLAKQLREGRPIYGLQAQGLDGAVPPHHRIDEMASCYVEEIREFQPDGPYFISGWSLGGLIALEVARKLQEAGASVPLLVMYDTFLRDVPEISDTSLMLRIVPQLRIPLGQLQAISPQQQWELIAERAAQSAGVGIEEIRRLAETCRAHMAAVACFQPKTYTGAAILFRADQARQDIYPRWTEICPRLRVATVPGDHYSMLQKPNVDVLAARLDAELAERPRELR